MQDKAEGHLLSSAHQLEHVTKTREFRTLKKYGHLTVHDLTF